VTAAGGDAVLAIEALGLAKRYGPVAALDGIDLTVPAGVSVAVLGPNGSGKSTLLRLLATLLHPTAGRVRLFGVDAGRPADASLRRRVGFLSHQTFLYEHLTGRENLVFYARLYGLADPEGAAGEAIGAVRLSHRGDDRVSAYSRGMQQRLAIARALLHRPDLILLDEPFTGLDRESSSSLEERLRRERLAGRTCVFTTHDPGLGLRAADRVLALRDGRLALDTPARGLDAARLEGMLKNSPAGAAPGPP